MILTTRSVGSLFGSSAQVKSKKFLCFVCDVEIPLLRQRKLICSQCLWLHVIRVSRTGISVISSYIFRCSHLRKFSYQSPRRSASDKESLQSRKQRQAPDQLMMWCFSPLSLCLPIKLRVNIENRAMGPKISGRVSKMWRPSNVEKLVGSEYLSDALRHCVTLFRCSSNQLWHFALCLATRILTLIGASARFSAVFKKACSHTRKFSAKWTLRGVGELTSRRDDHYLSS